MTIRISTLVAAVALVFAIAGDRAFAAIFPNPVATSITLPAPVNAFSTSVRYGPDGLLCAWDGHQVWRQTSLNGGDFAVFGTVNTGGADAGPINFSRDGSTLLIGDGAGGFDSGSNGLVYTLPASGGVTSTSVGTVAFNNDFIPLASTSTLLGAATKFYVDRGLNYSGAASEVDIFDFSDHSATPIVTNIPGASASMAMDKSTDNQYRLYVDVGYDGVTGRTGEIRRFTTAQLDAPFSITPFVPLNFNDGELINNSPNNSGAGMFVDARGNLFVGGGSGVTVFNSAGVGQIYSTGAYSTVSYNRLNDQFALYGFGTPVSVYNAIDFRPPVSWNVDASGAWSDGPKWNTSTAPNGIDQVVVLPGKTTATTTITLAGAVTLGELTFDSGKSYKVAGSSSLTMQASSGNAQLAVNSGQHEISAPLALASTTDVNVANATDQLTLSGGLSGAGGLNKNGAGALIVQAANTYRGDTTVNSGTLQFAVTSGVSSVTAGATVTIAKDATLELAGTVSALGVTGGAKAHIINGSASGGLVVSSGNQVVGGIDGTGTTTVAEDSQLTVDHIVQGALIINGQAGHPGLLTIAPSNFSVGTLEASQLNPGLTSRVLASPRSIQFPLSNARELLASNSQFAASASSGFSSNAQFSDGLAIVPEPTTMALALIGSAALTILASKRKTNATDRRLTIRHVRSRA